LIDLEESYGRENEEFPDKAMGDDSERLGTTREEKEKARLPEVKKAELKEELNRLPFVKEFSHKTLQNILEVISEGRAKNPIERLNSLYRIYGNGYDIDSAYNIEELLTLSDKEFGEIEKRARGEIKEGFKTINFFRIPEYREYLRELIKKNNGEINVLVHVGHLKLGYTKLFGYEYKKEDYDSYLSDVESFLKRTEKPTIMFIWGTEELAEEWLKKINAKNAILLPTEFLSAVPSGGIFSHKFPKFRWRELNERLKEIGVKRITIGGELAVGVVYENGKPINAGDQCVEEARKWLINEFDVTIMPELLFSKIRVKPQPGGIWVLKPKEFSILKETLKGAPLKEFSRALPILLNTYAQELKSEYKEKLKSFLRDELIRLYSGDAEETENKVKDAISMIKEHREWVEGLWDEIRREVELSTTEREKSPEDALKHLGTTPEGKLEVHLEGIVEQIVKNARAKKKKRYERLVSILGIKRIYQLYRERYGFEQYGIESTTKRLRLTDKEKRELRTFIKNGELGEFFRKLHKWKRVNDLTRYFFGGFGNKIAIISNYLYYLTKPSFTEEKRNKARDGISKSFSWIKRKYDHIPFSKLRKSPYYKEYEPLFKVNEKLPELEEKINVIKNPESGDAEISAAINTIDRIIKEIAAEGRKYRKTVNKYYLEFKGKYLGGEDIKTRALLEFRSGGEILEEAIWLKKNGIKPNSFERAAMDHYGIDFERLKIEGGLPSALDSYRLKRIKEFKPEDITEGDIAELLMTSPLRDERGESARAILMEIYLRRAGDVNRVLKRLEKDGVRKEWIEEIEKVLPKPGGLVLTRGQFRRLARTIKEDPIKNLGAFEIIFSTRREVREKFREEIDQWLVKMTQRLKERGKVLSEQREDIEAAKCAEILARIFGELGDKKKEARNYYLSGNIYRKLREFEKSAEYGEISGRIYEELGEKENAAESYALTAYCYKEMEQPRKAIEFYKKAASLYEELGYEVRASEIYERMAKCYEILSEFKEARECDEKAKRLRRIQPGGIPIQTPEQIRNLRERQGELSVEELKKEITPEVLSTWVFPNLVERSQEVKTEWKRWM
ncbi:MAG TPA: hypothetical protein ENF58_01350, partial [Candidatus Altiarchaeales archaeon]|nr:hypothetical protein [Candidatus Altiarchaeales archaeon]